MNDNDKRSEIQELFAEQQLQVNLDATVDFDHVIDNMNQEDVYEYYTAQGFSSEHAQSHMNGIHFQADGNTRINDIEPKEEVVQYQYQKAIDAGVTGNYAAKNDENLDRQKLGIENANPETQTRIEQIYENQSNEAIKALESTAKDIEDWNGTGEIFTGGGRQSHISDDQLNQLNKVGEETMPNFEDKNRKDTEGPGLSTLASPTSPGDNDNSDDTNNTPNEITFEGPGLLIDKDQVQKDQSLNNNDSEKSLENNFNYLPQETPEELPQETPEHFPQETPEDNPNDSSDTSVESTFDHSDWNDSSDTSVESTFDDSDWNDSSDTSVESTFDHSDWNDSPDTSFESTFDDSDWNDSSDTSVESTFDDSDWNDSPDTSFESDVDNSLDNSCDTSFSNDSDF